MHYEKKSLKTCFLANKETVSCYDIRNKTMQVTIMDKILKKEKHASHFGRENQASDLCFFALLSGKWFLMQSYVGKGNRCILEA